MIRSNVLVSLFPNHRYRQQNLLGKDVEQIPQQNREDYLVLEALALAVASFLEALGVNSGNRSNHSRLLVSLRRWGE